MAEVTCPKDGYIAFGRKQTDLLYWQVMTLNVQFFHLQPESFIICSYLFLFLRTYDTVYRSVTFLTGITGYLVEPLFAIALSFFQLQEGVALSK